MPRGKVGEKEWFDNVSVCGRGGRHSQKEDSVRKIRRDEEVRAGWRMQEECGQLADLDGKRKT